MGTTKGPQRSPRRHDGDPVDQFSAIVWKGFDTASMQKHWFDNPVDALACAVEYLKLGWQARLSDGAVAHFAALPQPGEPAAVPAPRFVGASK
jgi:hypothetical protein